MQQVGLSLPDSQNLIRLRYKTPMIVVPYPPLIPMVTPTATSPSVPRSYCRVPRNPNQTSNFAERSLDAKSHQHSLARSRIHPRPARATLTMETNCISPAPSLAHRGLQWSCVPSPRSDQSARGYTLGLVFVPSVHKLHGKNTLQ
jgi:hypothetical protein